MRSYRLWRCTLVDSQRPVVGTSKTEGSVGLPLHPQNCCHFQGNRMNSAFQKVVYLGVHGLLCHTKVAGPYFVTFIRPTLGWFEWNLWLEVTCSGRKWTPISKRLSNPVQFDKKSGNPHQKCLLGHGLVQILLGEGCTLTTLGHFGVKCSSLLSMLTPSG